MSKLNSLLLFFCLLTLKPSFCQSDNISSQYLNADSAEITLRVFIKSGHVIGLVNQMSFNLYHDSTVIRFWNSNDTFKDSKTITDNRNQIHYINEYEIDLVKYRIDHFSGKNTKYTYYIEFDDGKSVAEYKLKDEDSDILSRWFNKLKK